MLDAKQTKCLYNTVAFFRRLPVYDTHTTTDILKGDSVYDMYSFHSKDSIFLK